MSNKLKIGYTLKGNGPEKVIVLHDWMGDYGNWETVIKYLSFDQFTYAFMDIRGYGKSLNIKGEYTDKEIAADIFHLADDLGWDKFHLIGHSMTGMAVLRAAVDDIKNRIKSVIAVTPVTAAGMQLDEETLDFFNSVIQNEENSKIAFGVMTGDRLTKNWNAVKTQRHLSTSNAEALKSYLDMWTKTNFSDEVKGMKKPVLVVAGEHDHPGFSISNQKEAFKDFKAAKVIEAKNAGHYPMEETPVFLATIIEGFLENHT